MPFLAPPAAVPMAVGHIDGPGPKTTLRRGALYISGWAAFPSKPTARVELWLGEELLGRARLGFPRPDVADLFDYPAAGVCGFQLTANLAEWGGDDGVTILRATATSVKGEILELEAIPVTVGPARKPRPSSLAPLVSRTPQAARGSGRQLLVCTHQLNLGGAQLYLLDLLRELVKGGGITPTVISAMDGRTRTDLEDLGIPVHISSPIPHDDLSSHIGRVEELTTWATGRDFEVALVNTSTALAFPGAEVAAQLEIPAVWTIHESFAPPVLWSGMDARIHNRAEAALSRAAAVLFEAEATQHLYEPPLVPSQCQMVPYGIDLAPIERERSGFDDKAARREAGIPENADVVLCVGTIEPRKAQVQLAQAFEQIADRHPEALLVFVGGSTKPDSLALADLITASRWHNRMMLVPITPDVQRWYGLADLLVCASDVESLPRTVLEAMAWETPVLATNVFGLPELIEDGKNGWLCEASDIQAMASALDRVLETPQELRQDVARTARELVEQRHSLPKYANHISKLLQDVASSASTEPQPDLAR